MITFRQYISEGGGFGHLSHPFEIDEFTFQDLEDIIMKSLRGDLEWAREKSDGQNLLVSWKDGHLIAARNRGHLKNFGENALTVSGVQQMFSGRGELETAFTEAARDLETAISSLPAKTREKLFANGRKFMSVEVMYAAHPNIIHYGTNELRFHGTIEYDQTGKPISQLNKAEGAELARALDKVRAAKQRTFHLKELEKLQLKPLPDYQKRAAKYVKQLEKIRNKYHLSKSATIADYKRAFWQDVIRHNVPELVDTEFATQLINRWAFSIKQPPLPKIISAIRSQLSGDAAERVRRLEKASDALKTRLRDPIETVFLQVGADVLDGVDRVMAINPEYAASTIRKRVQDAIKAVQDSNDPALMTKLRRELERLEKLGGTQRIVPLEGITFFHKGELLKLTGTFAPTNQIINMLWRIRS